ncbi:MAG TPA: right-handed parallel beta-helix repeat-containing protein [Pyrinomonadaceae bacterium]|nr:right-handed parallel beta-helix repeat-containing protein [Pyrinomonadaceae bacterium]
MNKFRFTFRLFVIATFLCAFASMAQAQATRTWVSGVGDDVNPCSRTAPCKTFAGAISKTANNGEIDALDPGGFGAVTITKSITIDGTHGAGFGSILAAGTNGVNVNDGATATPNTIIVNLRNLSIQGAGTGFDGIRFVAGKALHVEGCVISGFRGNGTNSDGIDIALTGLATGNQNVRVTNTTITRNTGNGIRASNTAVGGGVLVTVDNSSFDGNARGFLSSTNCRATITNSSATLNTTSGIEIATGSLEVDIDNCVLASNTSGIVSAASTARIANCRITGNGNGISFTGGAVQSFGDNKVKGNGTDQNGGAVTNVPAPIKI